MTEPFPVSSPEKVLFPGAGITKEEVVRYYEVVASRMVEHIAGRPLTLHRFPDGIGADGFFQKNAADYFPESITRVTVPKREGGTTVYPVIHEERDLAYLANQNTIAFHVWTSRLPRLERPDRLILDLDPDEADVARVRAAARRVAEVLEEVGLGKGVPMTTGSKGFHVIVPIVPDHHIDELSVLGRNVAELAAHRHPDLLTTEFRIAKREGRVFVDWLRNRPGSTGVAPWSLRALPDAPVATPITWSRLGEVTPQQWTLRTVDEVLAEPDPILAAEPAEAGDAVSPAQALVDEAGIDMEPFDRFRS